MDDNRFERELKNKEILQEQADYGAAKGSDQVNFDHFSKRTLSRAPYIESQNLGIAGKVGALTSRTRLFLTRARLSAAYAVLYPHAGTAWR